MIENIVDKLLSLCIFTFSIPSPIFFFFFFYKKLIFSNTSFVMLDFFFKLSERVMGSNLAHITDTKRSSFIYFVVVVVVIIVTNTIILL